MSGESVYHRVSDFLAQVARESGAGVAVTDEWRYDVLDRIVADFMAAVGLDRFDDDE